MSKGDTYREMLRALSFGMMVASVIMLVAPGAFILPDWTMWMLLIMGGVVYIGVRK